MFKLRRLVAVPIGAAILLSGVTVPATADEIEPAIGREFWIEDETGKWVPATAAEVGFIETEESSALEPTDGEGNAVTGDLTQDVTEDSEALRTGVFTATRNYEVAGIRIAQHRSITTVTYNGSGYLYNTPRSIDRTSSIAPGSSKNRSKGWVSFRSGSGGVGISRTFLTFVFGVPTKWGPIGAEVDSLIRIRVDGYGNARWV
ncbi:hypothetical protein [Promicromonospora sp. NPDC090134]|uniref:hypothetical protein n=1 Tax=Promicromonospora sp. NPDC090134 TaxID=3364408 RepID=UPI0038023E2D